MAQLYSEDVEIWGIIEITKEFEWDNKKKIYYQSMVAIL